jgi:ribulose-5-phosphate 4-epimerase/fuculose-1-phosphate aldolase
MNVQAVKTRSLRDQVSEAEWQARVELAAAYRLMHHLGTFDMGQNHICLRTPGEPNTFLMRPMGMFFYQATASSIGKYDFDGKPLTEGHRPISGGGLVIHAGILQARPEINATIHTHATAIVGVASQKHGLLPINQHAMHFVGKVAYHDFGGFEFEISQREPLIRDLGDKYVALLRNHGSLVCGKTLGKAFTTHYQLDLACREQIAALSAGIGGVITVPEDIQEFANAQQERLESIAGDANWRGLFRMAHDMFPGFDV